MVNLGIHITTTGSSLLITLPDGHQSTIDVQSPIIAMRDPFLASHD